MPNHTLTGIYNPWLVVLSIVIAVCASYAALDMAARTTATEGVWRRMWLTGGALAMGAGIWSMHYVGMLAFGLPIAVLYDWPTVLLSLLAAILSSAVALIVVSRSALRASDLAVGSFVMGGGISAMHFIGMAAMRVGAHGVWKPWTVVLSIGIAVVVSMVALSLAFHLRGESRALAPRKLGSAVLMGCAIAAMHYTGMSAASFHDSLIPPNLSHAVEVSEIGVAGIVIVTFLVLGLALIASILDRRFASQTDAIVAGAARHRQLVERSLAGVFWGTMRGRITDCNEACARILGYASREALLQSESDHLYVSDETRNRLMASLALSGQLTDFECWLIRVDGSSACVLTNANLLVQDGEQIVEGTMVDITSRKIAEDELRACDEQLRSEIIERQRMEVALNLNQRLESVGQLAAGIAHEINTPVQFVNDSVHFLRDSLNDYSAVLVSYQQLQQSVSAGLPSLELAQAAAQIEQAVDLAYLLENAPLAADRALEGLERIATIVRSMKTFAHPDQAEKTHVDLNRAVMTTLEVARGEYKYVADVITDFGDIAPVLCYAGEINQVVLNLVVNAAHAIGDSAAVEEDRGRITISTRESAHATVLTVSDSGCGIPEEIRGRIFDPFFTTKEVGRGTGQGLAITRSIVVDKHGGTISLTSELGVGTTFVIELPREHQMAVAA